MSEKKKIATYVFVTLTSSFSYQMIIGLIARGNSLESYTNFLLVLMYLPGLIALSFLLIFNESFKSLRIGIKHPKFLIYSIVIPFIITFVCFALLELFGISSQTIFALEKNQIIFFDKQMSVIEFIPYFLMIMVLGSLQGGIFALGEEIGWRGYLQNKMIRKFGLIPGVILLGLVWGYWHLPIILMGYNFSEYRFLGGFVLMPLQTIAFSAVLAWLTLHAKSIWPAVLAHGSINFWLSDTFLERIHIEQKIWLYLLLTGLWLLAGIAALKALRDYKQNKNLRFD